MRNAKQGNDLKTCEALQMAMFANVECWLGFLPSLDVYEKFLTSYLSKSPKIWNFVHVRIICFQFSREMYQLANALVRGHHKYYYSHSSILQKYIWAFIMIWTVIIHQKSHQTDNVHWEISQHISRQLQVISYIVPSISHNNTLLPLCTPIIWLILCNFHARMLIVRNQVFAAFWGKPEICWTVCHQRSQL